MKFLGLIIVVLSVVTTSFADGGKKKMSMDERKAMIMSNIDKKIAALTDFKSCVSSASAKGDIKTCRQANKAAREKMKAERKEAHGK